MKKTIYLLRHGDTRFTGKYIGSTDCPLSDKGFRQIEKHRRAQTFSRVTTLFCSPMLRCKQSVEALQPASNVQYTPLLREIDFGLWEGLTFAEIYERETSLCKSWLNNPGDFVFPEGDSIASFRMRINDFVDQLKDEADENILLVTHGGVIRCLICCFLQLPFEKMNSFKMDTGTYAMLELYDDTAVLAAINRSG